MVTKLKEFISVYFWWGVIFGGIMNIVVNMGPVGHWLCSLGMLCVYIKDCRYRSRGMFGCWVFLNCSMVKDNGLRNKVPIENDCYIVKTVHITVVVNAHSSSSYEWCSSCYFLENLRATSESGLGRHNETTNPRALTWSSRRPTHLTDRGTAPGSWHNNQHHNQMHVPTRAYIFVHLKMLKH